MIILVSCPFCGGSVFVNDVACSVEHVVPTCMVWNNSGDALDFLRKMKREIEARTEIEGT